MYNVGTLQEFVKKVKRGVWWSMSDSNRPPLPCKGSALPDELMPQNVFGLVEYARLELATFSLPD